MLQYLVKRALLAVPTMLAVSVLVFLVLHLVPGDPAAIFIGDRPATPERLAQIRHVMGLDRPLLSQYADYLRKLGRGDLGRSIHTNASCTANFCRGSDPRRNWRPPRLPSPQAWAWGWAWSPRCGAGRGWMPERCSWRSGASPCPSSGWP